MKKTTVMSFLAADYTQCSSLYNVDLVVTAETVSLQETLTEPV